jgi:hypothetical protein
VPAIGVSSLFSERLIEKADWSLRRATRGEIVERVKHGELKPDNSYNGVICTITDYGYPPISTSGNQIMIIHGDSGAVTIEFYINRGFLDHYSAFVYSNDSTKIQELDERAKRETGEHINEKLEDNWYRVSY